MTRWQGQTHCVGLLGIPLVSIWGCTGYFPSITMWQFWGIQHIPRLSDLFAITYEYRLGDIVVAVIGHASEF